ncbi:MAG TPA: Mut7-C RNAse domain-containing protein, partial [Geminicoccaceae bacterium]|nr:Mut7-C RNAse domain-containing protein [Geminicoccaceae bacterium]
MFARLGRWLRAAGYDTRIALGDESDRALVLTAEREGRLLITRDRQILTIRRAPAATLVLPHGDLDACAAELSRRLRLDWRHDPFSRCVLCNVALEPAGPELGGRFAEASLDGRRKVTVCPA